MLVLETEVGGQKSMLSVMDAAVNDKMKEGLADKDAQRGGHAPDLTKSKSASLLPPRRHDVEFGEPSESAADQVPGAEGGDGDGDGIPQGEGGADFGYDDVYAPSGSFHASATSALALGMYPSSSSSSSRASGSRASASKRTSKSTTRRASASKQ